MDHRRRELWNHDSDSRRSISVRTPLLTGREPRVSCCRLGSRVRKVKSKGALLVLVWNFLVWTASYLQVGLFTRRLQQLTLSDPRYRLGFVLLTATVAFCPVGGWLADVYFGRYKVLHVSLQTMWLASVIGTVITTVEYGVPGTATVLHYCILLPTILLFSSGISAYIANAVPFATDQMLEASAEGISAFIHWFIWTWYAGQLVAIYFNLIIPDCTTLSGSAVEMVVSITVVVLFTLAVISDYLCQDTFIIEPAGQNPLKTVIRVLKYAATHRYPEQRSALTYWEEDIPSRIDLGKSKYGGPFTTEQVEDVKTFLRILAVIASISAILTAGSATSSITQYLTHHFKGFSGQTTCKATLADINSFYSFIVLVIPLYEFLVYPLARNWIPSMLRKVGIGAILIIVLNLFLFTMDTVGHSKDKSVPCSFAANVSSPVIDINYLWMLVPINLLTGLSYILWLITLFEFTIAQTPYSMKGLLTGIAWSVFALFYTVGNLINIVWSVSWRTPVTFPSCGFWYYLFVAMLAAVGLLIFILTARWYSKRERDERPYNRTIVEDVYDRYCEQNTRRFVGYSVSDSDVHA